ncbi:MAG: V-type ATP synthase subunit E [Clostridiales bacterium]|nr:V-type ATP synthase subunit E [Clostridiales bacterium]
MANISNLTSKIQKDAEERKESILNAAIEEKNKILSKKENAAKAVEAQMIEKAKIEAVTRKERIISSAELQARNEKLKAKQTIIQEVFDKSVDELCKLDNNSYKKFILDSILSLNIDGDETLIINDALRNLVDASLLEEINKGLTAKGLKGEISLSNETANFKGGFILEKNGIEINNTFEALVSSLKEELEFEVAKELFN